MLYIYNEICSIQMYITWLCYQGRKVRVSISISTDYHSRDLSVTVGFRMTENKHGDLWVGISYDISITCYYLFNFSAISTIEIFCSIVMATFSIILIKAPEMNYEEVLHLQYTLSSVVGPKHGEKGYWKIKARILILSSSANNEYTLDNKLKNNYKYLIMSL